MNYYCSQTHDVFRHGVDDNRDPLRVLDVLLDVVVPRQCLDEPESLLDDILVLIGVNQEIEQALESSVVHHGLAVLVPNSQAAQAGQVQHQVGRALGSVLWK